MTTSQAKLIDQALRDAADWQNMLADAYRHVTDSPERKEALKMARAYRRLLTERRQRRYAP